MGEEVKNTSGFAHLRPITDRGCCAVIQDSGQMSILKRRVRQHQGSMKEEKDGRKW